MPPPQAVVFDLYDTLAWSDWAAHAGFLAAELDVPADKVTAAYDYLRDRRDSGRLTDVVAVLGAVAAYCGVDVTGETLEDLARKEETLLGDNVTLYDDSLPVIRLLRSEGIRVAVLSNCSPSTRPVVDGLALEDEVEAVVLSCEAGVSKPSSAIYRIALEALGTTAKASWFVDDRSDYLDGARTVGMPTARIERDHAFGERVEGGDHPVIHRLDQIFDLL